jgi:hypothetical protein
MILAELRIQVVCPECHLLMANSEDGSVQCVFSWCGQYGIAYTAKPVQVELTKVSPCVVATDA